MKRFGLWCGVALVAGCAGTSGGHREGGYFMKAFEEVTTNKGVVRRFYEEAVNKRRSDVLAAVVAPDIVNHTTGGKGIEALAAALAALHEAFENLNFEVVDLIGEEDRIALRYVLRGRHVGPFGGQPATGQAVERPGINVFRLKDSKIEEVWLAVDPTVTRPPVPKAN